MRKKAGFFLFMLVILTGCENPGIFDAMKKDDLIKCIPYSLRASISEGDVQLTWETKNDADRYVIFRKEGDGEYIQLSDEPEEKRYIDTTYNKNKVISYKIKSILDGNTSEFSQPSNEVYYFAEILPVKNVRASVLTNSEGILLEWDKIDAVTEYYVYRYISKSDTAPEKIIVNGAETRYLDVATVNTPYFYKVSAMCGTVEGAPSDFVMGVYGETVDSYEVSGNDTFTQIAGQDGDSVFDDLSKPFIYSTPDGMGELVTDEDYYRYSATDTCTVSIKLDEHTVFKTGDVNVRFYINDEVERDEQLWPGINNEFYIEKDNTDDVIYIYVYVNCTGSNAEKKIVESYTIRVSEGF